jgi:hypothetical protein
MAYFREAAPASRGWPRFGEPAPQPSAFGVVSGFAFDSDRLGPAQHAALLEIARRMLAGTNTRFSLLGHTDTVGTAPYNTALGQRRAEAVRRALVATLERMQPRSSQRFQLSVASAGSADQRVSPNRGPAGGANRRVEIRTPAPPPPPPPPAPVPVPPPKPYTGPSIGPAEPTPPSVWCLGGQIACATLAFLRQKGGAYRQVSPDDRERAVQIEHRALMRAELPPLHPVKRKDWVHGLRRKAETRVADVIAGIVRR